MWPEACLAQDASSPFPMRTALLLAVAIATTAAHAQSTFRLVDPVLTVDNRRVGTLGAPTGGPGVLQIAVPGWGTYRVSDQPFGLARRAGAFAGTGLAFAADGKSVRLTSREPILDGGASAPAYVQFDPSPTARETGLARLSLAGGSPYGARPAAPRGPQAGLSPRSTGDAGRLQAEIDRLTAERARLLAERAAWLRAAPPGLQATAERDALLAERDRLLSERAMLTSERARAVAERAELAERLVDARRQLDAARSAGEQRRALGDADAVRAQIVDRDRALAVLRAERDDRSARLAAAEAELVATRQRLTDALAERDVLLVERDRLARERDIAFRERDALLAEREARFRSEGGWQAPSRSGLPRDMAAEAERDALRAERDAMRLQLEALQAERDRLRGGRSAQRPLPVPAEPALGEPMRDGSFVYLPGFDFGRLQNPDVIRRRLAESEYPGWAAAGRLEGEVLVLFQTDPSGRVIRTAVPMPLGGGLDALAEGIVREMRFVPPVVDGLPTGLRSQVTVRFER